MMVVTGPLADKVADNAEDVETALLVVVATADVIAEVVITEVEVVEVAKEVELEAMDVVVLDDVEVDKTVVTDVATEVDTADVLVADAADRMVVNTDAVAVAVAVVDMEVVVEEVLLLSPGRTSCPKGSCSSMTIIIEGPATMLSLAAIRFSDPAP